MGGVKVTMLTVVCVVALYNTMKHIMTFVSSMYENATTSSVPMLHLLEVDHL